MRFIKLASILILILLTSGCSGLNKNIEQKASTPASDSNEHKSDISADPPQNIHLSWTDNSSTTMTITWQTVSDVRSSVEYGINETELFSDTDAPSSLKTDYGIIHEKTIKGLQPGTGYYYRCGGNDGGWSEIHAFSTAPSQGPFSFAVLGDTQNDRSIRRNIAAAIWKSKPLFIIHCGDLTNAGGSKKLWTEWFEDMGELVAEIPIMPVMGNHENYCVPSKGLCQGMFERFALPDNGIQEASEYWYSFDVAGMHFIMLNSENDAGIKPGSKQYQWLENDLENNSDAVWKVAVMHKPPFSMGFHGDSKDIQEHWVPLFDRYGVDMVFSGHEHIYERTKPLKDMNPHEAGTVYIIAGSGGSWVYGCKGNVPEAKSRLYEKCEGICGFVLADVGDKNMNLSATEVNRGNNTESQSETVDSFKINKSDKSQTKRVQE
jgi:3',5'-cyclic AMP phosphodiesterase CpdA